jgi:hypothetical protein
MKTILSKNKSNLMVLFSRFDVTCNLLFLVDRHEPNSQDFT